MQLIVNETFKIIYSSKENHIIPQGLHTLINLKAIVQGTGEKDTFSP